MAYVRIDNCVREFVRTAVPPPCGFLRSPPLVCHFERSLPLVCRLERSTPSFVISSEAHRETETDVSMKRRREIPGVALCGCWQL